MNRRDDKTFLCVFDFPDQLEKGIFDKARDAIIRSLGSLSLRTNRVCEQGSLVDYRPYLHRGETKSQVSANTVPLFGSNHYIFNGEFFCYARPVYNR